MRIDGMEDRPTRMRDLALIAFLVLTAFSAMCLAAGGQTYIYADSTAASGGTGSESSPFNTIAAINSALQGDRHEVIKLKCGSTFIDDTLDLTNNDTLMKYGSGATPIIQPTSDVVPCILLTNPRNVLIEDVVLADGSNNFRCDGIAENVVLRRVVSQNSAANNGYAHEGTSGAAMAGGRIIYIECRAIENAVDGFNNRGNARDVAIRCYTEGHDNSGGSDDGYTTHGNSAWELWYCVSVNDEDGIHFTHSDSADAYNKVIGCRIVDSTALACNFQTSQPAVFRGNTIVKSGGTMIDVDQDNGTFIIDSCQFLGVEGGDLGLEVDSGGADDLVVRNCFFRMPENTTASSIYGVRHITGGGTLFVYNSTFVLPIDATESANYFALYGSAAGIEMANNVFLKTDEPNAYFARIDTATDLAFSDGNVFLDPGTNDSSWYIADATPPNTFAAWQALNKGVGSAASDTSGFHLAQNITTGTITDTTGTISTFLVRPYAWQGYGAGINCAVQTEVSNKFSTGYGVNGPSLRDGAAGAAWLVGPFANPTTQKGKAIRVGEGRTVFAGATIGSSWATDFPLFDSSILGDYSRRRGLLRGKFQVTGAGLITVTAGPIGEDGEILWAGYSGGATALLIDFDGTQWGKAGQDLFVTFGGTGTVTGNIECVEESVYQPSGDRPPKIPVPVGRIANER